RPYRAFDGALGRIRQGYRRIGPRFIRLRWAVLGAGAALLVLVTQLASGLGTEFLPQVDDGNINVRISLPPGASAIQTNEVAYEIEEIARSMPYVRNIYTTAGGSQWGGSTSEQSGRGNLTIKVAPATERDMTADEWVTEFQAKVDARGFPGARIYARPPRIRGLRTSIGGSAIGLTVFGDDLTELRRIGEEIIRRTHEVPGLQNLEISSDEASPILSIELDRERAAYLGLNVASVGQTLRTALDGTVATRYTDGNREYDVRVMFPRNRFQSPEDIGSIALFPGGARGAPIYVRDVATVTAKLGPSTINRENQNRVLNLNGDVVDEGGVSVGQVNDSIRVRLAGLELPAGYGLVYGGEEEAIRENNRQLAIVIALAIFLVFVVLAVQYESFVNPFVIILTIPLSLIGVGFALWLTASTLSAPVLLGVILLAGIVVNNAILLVDFAQQHRHEEGASLEEAVIEAGAIRLRPILMTTLTTVFGMLPLALGIGSGTELMQPLAIAVVGGLSLSAFLTLFVVPSAYVILNGAADTLQHWVTGTPRHALAPEPEGALGD
ncbi:MAG: efflux RND transporter permease subunit, partial [Longimicrobiales bacterium]